MQILSTVTDKITEIYSSAICDIYQANKHAFCKLENRWTVVHLLSRTEKEES